ncbi:hypothetical protein Phi13:1_gp090 [Cellulophaga phage phi13:1]|uniref:Uncharacterized protein n=1 Tax=Cellulophaga phage phi13:1 TaxID=1327992 RepID=S0A157_9CAUD|nr:hypothetical protein Phi13:1_gp090 [Cellulophaga phage phi13:1]
MHNKILIDTLRREIGLSKTNNFIEKESTIKHIMKKIINELVIFFGLLILLIEIIIPLLIIIAIILISSPYLFELEFYLINIFLR